MKSLETSNIPTRTIRPYHRQASGLIKDLKPILTRKYLSGREEDFDYVELSLAEQLKYVLYSLSGKLEGKEILDLGCGSINSGRESPMGQDILYEPWLCRTLKELGSNPIGVDVNDNSTERFRSYKVDLLKKGSLNFLPDYSIDLGNAHGLFTSPSLQSHPEILRNVLSPQLERVVKKDGLFIYSL